VTRTVVRLIRRRSDLLMYLYEPPNIDDADNLVRFRYSPQDTAPAAFARGEDRMNEIGTYMMEALFRHPAVEQAIVQQLAKGDHHPQPLLVRVPREAETMPWETLRTREAGFLALDPRSPIARLCPYEREPTTTDFQPPLRVLAVIAADDDPERDWDTSEWVALLGALETADFRVSVKALVANPRVLAEIEAADSSNVGVEATYVGRRRDVVREITSFEPNILHFFCHGRDAGGKPSLRISTRGSVNAVAAPITFEAADIPVQTASELWLVVLNCCGSAAADHHVGSFAFTLVEGGVPAVVGMRQEVEVTHANAFTESFYEALMSELRKPLERLNEQVEIDWPATMHMPRMAIAEMCAGEDGTRVAAESSREWTLPALYLAHRAHRVIGRPPAGDTPPIGLASKLPSSLLESRVARRMRGPLAPSISDEDRAEAEVKLAVLRELEIGDLGVPSNALARLSAERADLERALYGD